MSLNTLAAGLSWYDKLVEKIPEGQLFSWRAVFDAIPDLIEHLPTTLGLTIAGALFGLLLALLFAIVKINRTKVLFSSQCPVYRPTPTRSPIMARSQPPKSKAVRTL